MPREPIERKSRTRLAPQKSRKKLTETAKRKKKKAPLPKKGPLKKVRRKLGKPIRFIKKLLKGKDKDKKKK